MARSGFAGNGVEFAGYSACPPSSAFFCSKLRIFGQVFDLDPLGATKFSGGSCSVCKWVSRDAAAERGQVVGRDTSALRCRVAANPLCRLYLQMLEMSHLGEGLGDGGDRLAQLRDLAFLEPA